MPPRKRHRLLAPIVHAARVAVVVGLLLAIPSPSESFVADGSVAPTMDQLNLGDRWRNLATIVPDANDSGMWPVVDSQNQPVAMVARTLPAAADVVGYRGPTEAAIVLTPDLRILSVSLLSSADTDEHVQAVVRDDAFFEQFQGWTWGDLPEEIRVDAVSGATLTSLALAEGVLARLGGSRPSLTFPESLKLDDVADWFPDAASVDDNTGIVRDRDGQTIGHVLRTGPLSDDVIGYQGPTELLLQRSPEGTLIAFKIRHSFDNEPYVGYVRQERGFWALFKNMTMEQLAEFSPQQAGVEGVSGATMTSQAIADTLVDAALAARERAAHSDGEPTSGLTSFRLTSLRFTAADLGTIAILVLLAVCSRFRWFHHRLLRRCWLASVVIVIGVWSGNLMSMAIVAGWSAEGIAWRLAPALAAVVALALLAPPLTKHNPYCSHLCPHGAIQQWILPKPNSKRRTRLPVRLARVLRFVPGVTLVAAYLSLVVTPSIDLSSWEPFHAYLLSVAGWGSIIFALATLLVSARVPMAYCRFGCPTGRLLDHLRRTAVSDRIQAADAVAVGLLIFAWIWTQV